MKNRISTFLFISVLMVSACNRQPAYDKTSHGVTIKLAGTEQARQVKLDVISDEIIHVRATLADTFSREKSLIQIPDLKAHGKWQVEESDTAITVVTSKLKATVSFATGEVVFRDNEGNIILQEAKGGGKNFTSKNREGLKTYAIRQVFESPDDEAFYGLGAHQNGQMNYKGEDVELVQHNIVDVVPFLYSSKNYGLLWDNYSISKFGDPRDYQPLNSLKLKSRDGKAGYLTADYYVGDKIIKTVNEEKIDYEYLETPSVDNFPQDVARSGKVVWEGSFTSDVVGDHKFLVYASGYFKVWIDDKLIMDKWRQGWNPWTNKFTVSISNESVHQLKVEWIPDGGAYMAVKHLNPLPKAEQNKLSLFSEVGDEINYYFIKGSNADEVISGYRKVTGKAPIVPKWALGFWQSRERYRNQQELIDVVREYRKRQIPLDNIVLDWQYWEDPKWGSHEFDKSRFPDPKGMVDQLHNDLHANLMISVWPKFNKGTEHFQQMNERGFLFVRNIEKKRKDWVGVGYESTFYDPFNEEAGKLFWNQIDEKLNSLGVDAWWLDATEPDMHSNLSIDERKKNMSPTAMGPGEKYFNAYSLMNSKSVYEGFRKSSPDKRVFILTRSAFAGQQRYGATTWSGDIVSRWSDFQDQIAAGINFSLSGIPYWTMDIGGFAVERRYEKATGETLDEWRELNARWFQFGAFCPVFRSHGQYPYREIWNIAPKGHPAYESMVYYTKMRYHLMPYIYSLAGSAYFDDNTIMRGLVMDFSNDAAVHEIADQYMFGSSLLVNPVYSYKATSRELYLPAGTGWYDFYNGKYFEGGHRYTIDAPLERMPLFVKEGSIIPAGPEMQYSNEKHADPLTLYVFTGRDAQFTLYEDEGANYNYEHGKHATIGLSYNESTKTLTIGDRKGLFPDIQTVRTVKIVWVGKDHPVGVSLTADPQQVITYSGHTISIEKQ